MQSASRFIRLSVVLAIPLTLPLGGCALFRMHHVPDEMIAEPETGPGLAETILAGNPERADELIATGADVDGRGPGGATPLIAAAMTDANDIAARLLSMGARSDFKDDAGKNALAWALERDNDALVTLLVEHAKTNY